MMPFTRPAAMVSGSDPDDAPRSGARLPEWLPWLQLGVSTMLVVLFGVVLLQERQQARTLRRLEDRVEGLENSRALERTTALEEQLRAMVERLRTLERSEGGVGALEARQRELQREIDVLRERSVSGPVPGAPSARREDPGTIPGPPPPEDSDLPSGARDEVP